MLFKIPVRATFTFSLGLWLFAGCDGGRGNFYPPGAILPPDPVLGEDSDADGIRDDIGQYIDTVQVAEPLERDALRQYARAKRALLTAPLDRKAAVAAGGRSFRALECLLFIQEHAGTKDPNAGEEVAARTLDTPERARAYLAREKLLGGMHYALAPRGQAHAACDFDTSAIGVVAP
jgi:hypothetical protein